MISVVVPVFRNATSALDLVDALLQQQLPSGTSLEVVLVDDGSDDGSVELLRRRTYHQVRLLALPRNMGRSAARNAGASHASGRVLFFVDSDCRPGHPAVLAAHLRQLGDGAVASCGPVTGEGKGFWSRYQDDASRRRARRHASGATYAGSTANFCVRADSYRELGGFDSRYVEYGFEDRDLLVRLARVGRIAWCQEAVVKHLDSLSLRSVLEKLRVAGGSSALLFSEDHPEEYRALGYAALDVRLHPWLRPLSLLLKPLLGTAPALDHLLRMPQTPYRVVRFAVGALSALAYMCGTSAMPGNTPRS